MSAMPRQDEKAQAQQFWGSLSKKIYSGVNAELGHEELIRALDELEDMFRFRRHMAVVEMPLGELAGKRVLEIGSGNGGHSALFARKGAIVTSVDLTPERARATGEKFALLGGLAQGCAALQGDGERLPFADGTFDIVYSNGVLHHTPDTEAAIAEAHRVLKPGGLAVIMLYCKSSWAYWFNYWFCVGLLQGRMFGDPHWLGHATEWTDNRTQPVRNPITRCYTRNGIQRLFRAFEPPTLRKAEFYFYLIPKIGRLYRRWQIRRYGTHPGGRLVYGEPWPIQSPLELRLGRVMGWAWFIRARKPAMAGQAVARP